MFQRFNTDTLISRFIKNLIYNTRIPKYKSICDGDYIYEGCFYACGRDIIKCTSPGYFKIDTYSSVPEDAQLAKYTQFMSLYGNQGNLLTTENWMSKNTYYDHETHEMLGEYLRYFKSYSKVDLMPFYNCYNQYFTSTFYIRKGEYWEGVNDAVQVALFPIKFDRTYTIAVDSTDGVEILPVILCDQIPLKAVFGGQVIDFCDILKSFYVNYPTSSFKQPFLFSVDISKLPSNQAFAAKYMAQNERSLYLAMQLPKSNTSSVVVLEGNYINNTKKIVDRRYYNQLSQKQKDSIFLSELSLLRLNDSNSYAFSDKLIEYLTLNVVTPTEEIAGNITLAQKVIDGVIPNMYPGVWEDKIRTDGFDFFMNGYQEDSILYPVDINGYFDKDIERLLLKRLSNA